MKKLFESKLGGLLKAEKMEFNATDGYIGLKKAEVITEAFDELHFPFALKGGYIDEMSIAMPVSMFSKAPAKVSIKNVFFVAGPHVTDWTWDHVYKCKTKLVDLVMKIYELKPSKKKKKKAKGGFMADLKNKMVEDMKKKFLGMLEVHISNIHFRYEDTETQAMPFAFGGKMGFITVNSQAAGEAGLRTTGDWKNSSERHTDPFFCQIISARRLSMYWDIGDEGRGNVNLFDTKMVPGSEVKKKFMRLNLREIFSLAVVENVLQIFKPEHPRRKYLEGPCFRERLDFHRYIVFPASLNAHVTVNRPTEAMRAQKAPLKDADVMFEPVEVAMDSEQIRSMNELLSYKKEFQRKDSLFRTRPREPISNYIEALEAARVRSSSSAPASDLAQRGQKVVKAWWHHLFQGVKIMCAIPKSHLDAEELRQKAKLREEYIKLALADMDAAAREKDAEKGVVDPNSANLPSRQTTAAKLAEMQMLLPLNDILSWRNVARDERQERSQEKDKEEEAKEEDDDGEAAAKEAAELQKPMPNTLQVRVHYSAFQGYMLVVADRLWAEMLQKTHATTPGGKCLSSAVEKGRKMTRQLVIKAQALDIRMEVVQKGRNQHRIARWAEVGIGNVSVTNCNAKKSTPATRQMLSMQPFEMRQGVPLCVYVGFSTFEMFDRNYEQGDMPITSVLEPSEGVSAHLRDFSKDRPELLDKLGFLKDFKDELHRLMIFAFVRVGQVRVLDYQPFRRRVEYFMKRGKIDRATDLVRRPSPLALDRELLVKLQRKVEKYTGKSNMLGIIEGVTDGVRGRLVDHYNSQHVLCKEVSLAPMRCKALRNGCPQTFHCQFHQMLPREDQRMSGNPIGDSFGLLPWKAAMLLLPKADFAMGLEMAMDKDHNEDVRKAAVREKPAIKDQTEPTDNATIVLAGSTFLKWGRNGKAKKRFIIFNENLNAIVWKEREDKKEIGAVPLWKVQDICTGVQTPVLQKVRNQKLKPDRVWSIIATDRTLDLQAESLQQRDRWVAGLKARYKKYVQKQNFEQEDKPHLPRALAGKMKSYPEKYRSDRCGLRSTYRKLQAVTALKKSMDASSNLATSGKPQQSADAGKGPASTSSDDEGARAAAGAMV